MPKKIVSKAILSALMAEIGAAGGKKGTGKAKRRGSRAYYLQLAQKAVAARAAKKRAREQGP